MLWYNASWTETLWVLPCIFWICFNGVVLKIVRRRWLEGCLTDADIIRLSIPVAELMQFLTMVFLYVPVCAFKACFATHQVFICGYVVAGMKKLTRFAATYTTVAIIIDLHAGITDPLAINRSRLVHKFDVLKVVAFIWLLSVVLTVPRLRPYDRSMISTNSSTEAERKQEVLHAKAYHSFLFAFDFVIPISIIVPLCFQMIKTLRRSPQAPRRSMYVIIGIVALNFTARLPYHVTRLFYIVLSPEINFKKIQSALNWSTKIMYFMFPLNALLYWGLYPEFLTTFMQFGQRLMNSLCKHGPLRSRGTANSQHVS